MYETNKGGYYGARAKIEGYYYMSTGCYNLKCDGFVPANGAELICQGKLLLLHQLTMERIDINTGDWVLFRDDLDKPLFLSHFPMELCPKLIDGAPKMAWAGFVSYPKNEPGPAMGSGHFPGEGKRKAAYIKNIKFFDERTNAHEPSTKELLPVTDRPDCYKLSRVDHILKDRIMFYYGGPNGCNG
uniref:Neprosin PEP catalytic domain-containing protein n=1 Tax=Leersia perrieri TaxID=77586 RepID=A0A0D9WY69_9ORYZ